MLPEHENVGTVLLDIGMFLDSIGWSLAFGQRNSWLRDLLHSTHRTLTNARVTSKTSKL
jgi:hypothetical protein